MSQLMSNSSFLVLQDNQRNKYNQDNPDNPDNAHNQDNTYYQELTLFRVGGA